MPKKAQELSALTVSRLKTPGFHAVGGVAGLHLQVSKRGARSWILRVVVGSRRRDVGLGGFPDVSLAMAREKARQIREKIEQGVDPVAERKAARQQLIALAARSKTFDECAAELIKRKQVGFRSAKHAKQWSATLKRYASPVVGNLPVDAIELGHITQILEPIWATKTETAARLRGRIEAVLDFGIVHGWRSDANPARWKNTLDAVLAAPSKVKKVEHHRALAIDDVPEFMLDLRKRDGMGARALEFAILTASRSGEVRGATWAELDLDGKVWIIPGQRMKAEREHRVPLSSEVLILLHDLPRFKGSDLVFPSARGGKISDMSLTAVLRRMDVDAVPHGFRSTFRDWCAERTNYPREVAEMALAHVVENKVEAAYRRGDLFEKRRRLMAEWGRFCSTLNVSGEVVPIGIERKR